MAKRLSQTSLVSTKVIVRENNKPVHAASADIGRSDTANRYRGKLSRLIHPWQKVSRSVSFCRTHASKRVGRERESTRSYRRGGIAALSRFLLSGEREREYTFVWQNESFVFQTYSRSDAHHVFTITSCGKNEYLLKISLLRLPPPSL